jgi:allantoin racemase
VEFFGLPGGAAGGGREYWSLRGAFVSQAEPIFGPGIDVIIPAGGYPMLLFAREPFFVTGGAILLNGPPAAVAAAETAIGPTRLNGTGTSRRTAGALPPTAAVIPPGSSTWPSR